MLAIAAGTVSLTLLTKQVVKKESYDKAVKASELMQECMDAVKAEKISRGIEIPAEDTFQTGLIGEKHNYTTTTDGDLTAKRTTCNPNMAAMILFMLEECGVKAGDKVGCNFSGSFPALNIATLCAIETLGAEPVYICSCGASTWGANNQEYTFPEMALTLCEKGLIRKAPSLFTPGGSADSMHSTDEEEWNAIWNRVSNLGIPTMVEEDYAKNLAAREAVFDEEGISCFVAVGGNLLSLGKGDVIYLLGQGIVREEIDSLNEKSGLIEYYLNGGTPSIFLLNIKKLVADYGIPYDPAEIAPIGTLSMYYQNSYNTWIILAGLALELALLAVYKRRL